jgi:hypothetical protein
MTNHAGERSAQRTARVAGLAFLFIVIGYTLSWVFVYAKLIVPGNAAATGRNIMAHEPLFRAGMAGDLMVALSALVLAWALYLLLKPVNKNLALLGLLLKFADAILAIFTVSLSFIALHIAHGEAGPSVFTPEQLPAVAGLLLNLHAAAAAIPMVLTGLGFIVFFHLLFKSKYVPGALSGFGIFSYLLILASSLLKILGGKSAAGQMGALDMALFAPSVLFELAVGLWLVIKGVNMANMQGDKK